MINLNLLDLLQCPLTKKDLSITIDDSFINLASYNGEIIYDIFNNIPRFVPKSNYADNFGKQWNHFRKTQLDSYSGHPISANRFWSATGWTKHELKGKWVLDLGCGSGRFSEIALSAGAHVVGLDYSSAIDACYRNLSHFPNFYPLQGDIYNLPFKDESFDYIYCLGVLQHTPDVEKAFSMLPRVLKGGGKICIDTYWKRIATLLDIKYFIRPISKRMDSDKLFTIIQKYAYSLLKFNREVMEIPFFGKYLSRMVPIADYKGRLPLNNRQLLEWAILDTFDMLSPKYDKPQSIETLRKWFYKYGLINTNVKMAEGLNGPTATGEKPK